MSAGKVDFTTFASGKDLLIQTGTMGVTIATANTRHVAHITFDRQYETPPIVLATNSTDDNAAATQIFISCYNTYTSGASFRFSSIGFTGDATGVWIAIGEAKL